MTEYLLHRLIWLGCFVAYMFYLGYHAKKIWSSEDWFLKAGHGLSVFLTLFGCLAGLLML